MMERVKSLISDLDHCTQRVARTEEMIVMVRELKGSWKPFFVILFYIEHFLWSYSSSSIWMFMIHSPFAPSNDDTKICQIN